MPRTARLPLIAILAVLAFAGSAAPASAEAPPNDNFASPIAVDPPRSLEEIVFIDATSELGEPHAAVGGTDQTVWLTWQAPGNGLFRVSTCTEPGSSDDLSDLWVAVYSGTELGALTELDHAVDNCPGSTANAVTENIPVVEGQTYRVQLGVPAAAATTEDYRVHFDFNTAVPANDNWANAQEITGALPQTIDVDNGLATQEVGEPAAYPEYNTNTVWYRWTPSDSGVVSVDTCGSTPADRMDSVVDIFNAGGGPAALATLNNLASNDDGCGAGAPFMSHMYAEVTAGTEYWIRLFNYSMKFGSEYSLRVRMVTELENNGAYQIYNGALPREGTMLFATPGTWSAPTLDDLSVSHQWLRCSPDGLECSDIGGATSTEYAPTSEDNGASLRFRTQATWHEISLSYMTDPTGVVDGTPANDHIANAMDLGTDPEVNTYSDVNFATAQEDETGVGDAAVEHSVWFRWTAPSSVAFAIGTCTDAPQGDDLDLGVRVYHGDGTIAGSTLDAEAGGGCGTGSRARTRLTAESGTQYWIQVTADRDNDSRFTLSIRPAPAPFFTGNSQITGDAIVNGQFEATAGTYYSALETAITYSWELCDSNGDNCAATGVTDSEFDIPSDAAGKRARFIATITSESGTETQDALSSVIDADDDADSVGDSIDDCVGETGTDPPGNGCQLSDIVAVTAPLLSGSAAIGQTLSTTDGDWDVLHNPLTISTTREWLRCSSANEGDCVEIPGAAANSYVVSASDAGSRIAVRVTATNAEDSLAQLSNFTSVIPAPPNDGGGGGGGSTPPVDPFPTPTVAKSLGSLKLNPKGSISFPKLILVCGASASGPCVGTLTITTPKAKVKGKTIKSAKQNVTLSVAPGASMATTLKLNAKIVAAVKKTKKLKASFAIELGAPGFDRKKIATSATLKK